MGTVNRHARTADLDQTAKGVVFKRAVAFIANQIAVRIISQIDSGRVIRVFIRDGAQLYRVGIFVKIAGNIAFVTEAGLDLLALIEN